MTIIAVTQRVDEANHGEIRDSLDQRWSVFLNACHLTPLILQNHLSSVEKLINKYPINGVLLTGGNCTEARDAVENFLIEYAINNQIPLMGVCHGMQMIQSFFGVSLQPVQHHVQPRQSITVNGSQEIVNSFHDLGTTETVPELTVWAHAEDGVVKAVRHITLPMVGIMWHPERFQPFQSRDIELFKTSYL